MTRTIRLFAFGIVFSLAGLNACFGAEPVWHYDSWDQAIATIPCNNFAHNPNGTWKLNGTVILPNGAAFADQIFGTVTATFLNRNAWSSDTKMMLKRCPTM